MTTESSTVGLQPWTDGPYLAFDVETTDRDPFEARIISASVLLLGFEIDQASHWLINPGVEIPEEVTRIHGITNEMVSSGREPKGAIEEITQKLQAAWKNTPPVPVVVFSAPYDMTVLLHERDRHGLPLVPFGPIVDPLVIDRRFDRYRGGKARLEDCCRVYNVDGGDPHDPASDARAAARILWRQVRRYPEVGTATLEELQVLQAVWHRDWAADFQDFLRYRAREPKPDAVIEGDWPVRQRSLV